MRFGTALGSLLLLASVSASAQPQSRPVVVELFTSQGCSSCPPADAFLADLARSRPDVLALGYHVTYWNSLGWRDPYSLDAATQRQRHYARLLSLDNIYTPQMVVDGRRDVVGSNRRAAVAAIQAAGTQARGPALRLTHGGGEVTLDVGAGTGRGALWLVGYDPEHRTAVGRGENGGRTLLEANIVREIADVGGWTGAPVHLSLTPPKGKLLAIILQGEDGGIIGAARADDAPAS